MKNKTSGISLISLIITIVVILILTSVVVVKTKDYIDRAKLSKFNSTIVNIQHEVESYINSNNNVLPVKKDGMGEYIEYSIPAGSTLESEVNTSNCKAGEKFYTIDLKLLNPANAQEGMEKTPDDLYIVSEERHNVFYGYEYAGNDRRSASRTYNSPLSTRDDLSYRVVLYVK